MRYAEPSIVEALCEFVFAPGDPWDFTVFGRFDELLKARLPHRDQIEVLAMNLRNLDSGIEQAVVREPRLRFFDSAKTRLAQVGPNLLSANVLAPYPHWPQFRVFILECMQAYAAAAKPASVDRLTLRYIDQVRPQHQAPFRLGDWIVTGSAYVPGFLADSTLSASSRVQKTVIESTETVSVVLQKEADGRALIMLDTELVVRNLSLAPELVASRLDQLHERAIEVFESCITDRTRDFLKPEAT